MLYAHRPARLHRRTRLLLAAGIGCLLPVGAPSAVAQSYAGTYAFTVTSGDGRLDSLVARGRFALAPTPVDLAELPEELVGATVAQSEWFVLPREDGPNACLGFSESVGSIDGTEFYGGIVPFAFTRWDQQEAGVSIRVYGSPDAAQVLRGRLLGGVIEGYVEQQNFDGTSRVRWLPFRAIRTGDYSAAACQEALAEGAGHVRHRNVSSRAGLRQLRRAR